MAPRYNPSIRRIRPARSRAQRPVPLPARKLSPEDIENIRALMKEQLGGREPRTFQLDLVQAQEERRDALCQAATGQGKTAVAAGPYALDKNANRVTLMVSPLIGLQNEMAETFRKEFNLTAVAVNSSTEGGCSSELMTEIVHGKHRIVLISPEMLLSAPFINGVLRHPSFASRVYSVIIDEAHCISHWGADFRKQYSQIGMIRVFLPRDVPFIALSASLTEPVIHDIIYTLQFNRSNFLHRNLGNDRSNVSLVVRAIHNSQQSFTDLDFIIPSDVTSPSDIPKTWIYADNIDVGTDIIDHLREHLPPEYHELVRPYNAVHDDKYREEAMKLFREGKIRILVCTDAAGMGCNIPDIDVVVQWKLPAKLSSFIQRAGRAARDASRQGLAVLLVEPAAYSILTTSKNEEAIGGKANKPKRANHGKAKGQGFWKKATVKGYAASRGRLRGAHNCLDAITRCEEPRFDPDDPSEGLYNFVQATTCRRSVIGDVFNNPRSNPTVPCCDLCDPKLLDRTRPGAKQVTRGRGVQYSGAKCDALVDALEQWREDTMERDEPDSLLPSSSILPDSALDKLATLALPISHENIKRFLAPQWPLWPKYGDELTAMLLAVDVLADSCSDECLAMPIEETCLKRARSDSAAPVTDAGPADASEFASESLRKKARIRPPPSLATSPTSFVNPKAAFRVNPQTLHTSYPTARAEPLMPLPHAAALHSPAITSDQARALPSSQPPLISSYHSETTASFNRPPPPTRPAAPALHSFSSPSSSKMPQYEHQVPVMLSAASTVPSPYVYHHYGIPPVASSLTTPSAALPGAYGVPPDAFRTYGTPPSMHHPAMRPPTMPRTYGVPPDAFRTYSTPPSMHHPTMRPPAMPRTYGVPPSMPDGTYGVPLSAPPPFMSPPTVFPPTTSRTYSIPPVALPSDMYDIPLVVPPFTAPPPSESRMYGVLHAMPGGYGVAPPMPPLAMPQTPASQASLTYPTSFSTRPEFTPDALSISTQYLHHPSHIRTHPDTSQQYHTSQPMFPQAQSNTGHYSSPQ